MVKDFRTIASGVVGVGNSAEVYEVEFMYELEKEFLTKFRKLTPAQKEKVTEFVEFLVWREQKQKESLFDVASNSENENND